MPDETASSTLNPPGQLPAGTGVPPGTTPVPTPPATGGGGGEEEMSEEESEILRATTDLLRQQIEALTRNNQLLTELYPLHRDFFREQTQFAIQSIQSQARLLPLGERTIQSVLGNLDTFVQELGFQPGGGAAPGLTPAPPGFQTVGPVGPGQALAQGVQSLREVFGRGLSEFRGGPYEGGVSKRLLDVLAANGISITEQQAEAFANGTLEIPADQVQGVLDVAIREGLIQPPEQHGGYYIGPDGTRYNTAAEAYGAAGLPVPEPPQSLRQLSDDTIRRFLEGDINGITPEQQAHIETVFGEARRRGTEEIQRFAEEQAAGRGLSLTDTPIGSESLRAKTDLEERLQAGQAAETLSQGNMNRDFALAVAQNQQGFAQNVENFQRQLRFAAEQARANIAAGLTGAAAGNISSLPGPDSGGTLSGLTNLLGQFQQGRLASAQLASNRAESDRRFALDDYRFRNPPPVRERDAIDYIGAFGNLVGGAAGAYRAFSGV